MQRQDKFYTVKTLAEKLGVHTLTIYRMIREGKISAVRLGPTGRTIRFDPDAVAAFLESVRVGPGGLKKEGGNKP